MRLSIEKRHRLVFIYEKNELTFKKGRFKILCDLAKAEDIIISELGARNIIKKWQQNNDVADRLGFRNLKITKITGSQLKQLDKQVYKTRSISAKVRKV